MEKHRELHSGEMSFPSWAGPGAAPLICVITIRQILTAKWWNNWSQPTDQPRSSEVERNPGLEREHPPGWFMSATCELPVRVGEISYRW